MFIVLSLRPGYSHLLVSLLGLSVSCIGVEVLPPHYSCVIVVAIHV